MNALIIDPDYPVQIRPIDPTRRDPVGGGALSIIDQWAKPKNEFTLVFPTNDIAAAEALYAFYLRHRGSNPFWFDGAGRCEITVPQVFWIGDGVTTEFMLPFDNLLISTWVFYQNGAPHTGWTMDEASGLVTWSSPPVIYVQISGKGKWLSKCVFWGDGESLYSSAEFASRIFGDGITIREVP